MKSLRCMNGPVVVGWTMAASARLRDLLVDGTENGLAVLALHLDADGVAELHELGRRLAVLDGLDGALLGDAAVALGPVHAAVLLHALVAHRARADDAAGAHVARLADVRDELA